jgi:AraC family transcriptional regulator
MQWSEMFGREREPSDSQIRDFVDSPLWDDLDSFLKQKYGVKPKIAYSGCSMDDGMWRGWNVKYQKSGKALCTLYPKQGYIQALVPIGVREMNEAELLMPFCSEYTQNLFSQTASGRNGKSLTFVVENAEVLYDMKELIAIRMAK